MELDMNTGVALFTVWGMRVLSAVLILIAGWVIGNGAKRSIFKAKKLDETLKSFLGGLAKYAIMAVAIVTILGQFGVQTASLIAVLGAAGLAIGLALQGTLSNVAAGVMMLILRPFNVGDFIEYGSISGTVKSLGLFGCELIQVDNIYVFAPNSHIWNAEIKNYNRNLHRRMDINIGISYRDDIDKAFRAIHKTMGEEKRLLTSQGKEPQVMVCTLGESSVDLIVRAWTTTGDFWSVKWDLTKAIKEALDAHGITIPFPTRTIETFNAGEKSKKEAA
jgi:small conductance mechanosensitive channel